MPHIHDKFDFVVSIFVIHEGRVLFVKHKQLKRWLPVGGHVELDEDPETAAIREVKEESGLDITLLGERPDVVAPNGRSLIAPVFLDIHEITPTHRHIGMVYFARAESEEITLAPDEHDEIRWLSTKDLDDPAYDLLPQIRFYALEALRRAA